MPLTVASGTFSPLNDTVETIFVWDGSAGADAGVYLLWFQLEDHTDPLETFRVALRRQSTVPSFPAEIVLLEAVGDPDVYALEVGPIVVSEEETENFFTAINLYLYGASGATDIVWTMIQVDATS